MNGMQVSIVAFKKGQLRVLSHAWDRNLGGRDFDEVLFNHFCAEFGAKHKIDIKSNARASFRLRQACEKVCMALSTLPSSHGCVNAWKHRHLNLVLAVHVTAHLAISMKSHNGFKRCKPRQLWLINSTHKSGLTKVAYK